MIFTRQDICSYDKEQAADADTHNMVSVAMKEEGLDVQGAMDYISEKHRKLVQTFVDDMANIPSFPEPVDSLVSKYVLGIADWVTANMEWSFESERYFGKRGREIQSQLVFQLRPKLVKE